MTLVASSWAAIARVFCRVPGDAAGFPVTISAPGSYALTGDILLQSGESGIKLNASQIALNLNGFRIAGPVGCSVGTTCAFSAIFPGPNQGHDVTVRNGILQRFGQQLRHAAAPGLRDQPSGEGVRPDRDRGRR